MRRRGEKYPLEKLKIFARAVFQARLPARLLVAMYTAIGMSKALRKAKDVIGEFCFHQLFIDFS